MRTLCGATCRGRGWAEATSETTTTTSRQSTSPFTRQAPTTSWVSHQLDSQSSEAVIKANVYSNLHIVWHKVALWCYWHHCPPDCSGATFGHTVRPDITDCRGIMPSALCSLLQLFIQLNFNHLFIQGYLDNYSDPFSWVHIPPMIQTVTHFNSWSWNIGCMEPSKGFPSNQISWGHDSGLKL